MLVHTHASEQRDEIDVVRAIAGMGNLAYLADTGLATSRLCAAHCVWVDDAEQALMAEHDVKVMHCPGSNLKLGSGLAPVVEMRARGITVSLGADGAACNNRLDMFDEMRLAATLQAVRLGPGACRHGTSSGWRRAPERRTLGLDDVIGQVSPGFRADLIAVDVIGTEGRPVARSVLVTRVCLSRHRRAGDDGRWRRARPRWPASRRRRLALAADARHQAQRLRARAGL